MSKNAALKFQVRSLKVQKNQAENLHQPVLLAETLKVLNPQNGETFVDATLGLGGHTEAILAMSDRIRVIGIDQDREAIKLAKVRLRKFDERIEVFHANFSEIKQVLIDAKIKCVDGVLADLGVSSLQFDSEIRGFSFRFDAPLDMRMNADLDTETAAELLENLSEEEIANVIYKYGEERFSRRIARKITFRLP